LNVRSVTITALGCQGRYGIYATADVKTDGAASGTLYFTWFYSDSANGRVTDLPPTLVTLSPGQTDVQATKIGDFSGHLGSTYWGVQISTDPAAASGNGSSQTLVGSTCQLQ
jgi:serine/threonine-protein kinase